MVSVSFSASRVQHFSPPLTSCSDRIWPEIFFKTKQPFFCKLFLAIVFITATENLLASYNSHKLNYNVTSRTGDLQTVFKLDSLTIYLKKRCLLYHRMLKSTVIFNMFCFPRSLIKSKLEPTRLRSHTYDLVFFDRIVTKLCLIFLNSFVCIIAVNLCFFF